MGRFQHGVLCTWQLAWPAVEEPWSALAGPFLSFLTQMDVDKTPLPFRSSISGTVEFSVRRSIHWSEGADYCELANEWVWQRSRTLRGVMDEPLAKVSSASSQKKWKIQIIHNINSLRKTFRK